MDYALHIDVSVTDTCENCDFHSPITAWKQHADFYEFGYFQTDKVVYEKDCSCVGFGVNVFVLVTVIYHNKTVFYYKTITIDNPRLYNGEENTNPTSSIQYKNIVAEYIGTYSVLTYSHVLYEPLHDNMYEFPEIINNDSIDIDNDFNFYQFLKNIYTRTKFNLNLTKSNFKKLIDSCIKNIELFFDIFEKKTIKPIEQKECAHVKKRNKKV